MSEEVKMIRVVNETLAQSLLSDAGTIAMLVSLVLVGKFIGSEALQWVGAIMGFLAVLSRASKSAPKMTIEEARAYLDKLESSE